MGWFDHCREHRRKMSDREHYHMMAGQERLRKEEVEEVRRAKTEAYFQPSWL